MQLFSKGSMEAEEAERQAIRPPPIKHNIRLTGFGAAARLNERGYALQRSPYRSATPSLANIPFLQHACSSTTMSLAMHMLCCASVALWGNGLPCSRTSIRLQAQW